ncbi:MAG: phage major capsid protein [Sphingomonas taxi]
MPRSTSRRGLAGEIASEFAKAEGAAFVGGTGVNRPKGFLTAPVVDGAGRRAGRRGRYNISPPARRAIFGTAPDERLLDLVHALRAPYRQGRELRDEREHAGAHPQVQDCGTACPCGSRASRRGSRRRCSAYPVVEAEDMPDIAANALSIAFGDFRSGYLIAERAETAILRDPYTNKPFVSFYATKRIGGCVADSEALKLMKFATA